MWEFCRRFFLFKTLAFVDWGAPSLGPPDIPLLQIARDCHSPNVQTIPPIICVGQGLERTSLQGQFCLFPIPKAPVPFFLLVRESRREPIGIWQTILVLFFKKSFFFFFFPWETLASSSQTTSFVVLYIRRRLALY